MVTSKPSLLNGIYHSTRDIQWTGNHSISIVVPFNNKVGTQCNRLLTGIMVWILISWCTQGRGRGGGGGGRGGHTPPPPPPPPPPLCALSSGRLWSLSIYAFLIKCLCIFCMLPGSWVRRGPGCLGIWVRDN